MYKCILQLNNEEKPQVKKINQNSEEQIWILKV